MQTLKNKITEATKHLNISQSELSIRLNKSRNYLSEMVRNGCTTAKQKELIEMIDLVMLGEVFKSDSEVIAELTEKLSDAQDLVKETTIKAGEIAESNIKISNAYNDLKKANIELMEESDKYHNANTELNAELNTMRKNAQEADTVLKNTQDDLNYIKAEKDQLRKAVSDRDTLNKSLNAENAELAEQLGFKTKRVWELITELDQTIEFSQQNYASVCDEKIKLQSKVKSANNWTMAFIVLTLVLSGLLVWVCDG